MSNREEEYLNPERFIQGDSFKASLSGITAFEAYQEELDDDYVIISDCRMTRTTPAHIPNGTVHGVRIKEQYGQDADDPVDPQDLVMMLYIEGFEWKDPQNDAIRTAKGKCVFFVHRPDRPRQKGDHKPINSKEELVIKKSAHCYFLVDNSDQYKRFPFSEITRVLGDSSMIISSSSPASSHRQRALPLNLYPDGL